jgi:hypothetical protein
MLRPVPLLPCAIIGSRDCRNIPVLRLILAFVDIALHRRGPDQLPSSRFFFLIVLAVSVGVELLALQVAAVVDRAVIMTLMDTVIDIAFVWAVLKTFDRTRRFNQTMSALLGVDTLMNVMSVLLVLWNQALDAVEGATTIPALLFIVLAVWSIDVAGFVLSRALDRPYALGVAIMLGYVLLSISLRMSLFPTAS